MNPCVGIFNVCPAIIGIASSEKVNEVANAADLHDSIDIKPLQRFALALVTKVDKRQIRLVWMIKLDSGSIKTSPRDGLRAIGKETTPNCAILGHSDLL